MNTRNVWVEIWNAELKKWESLATFSTATLADNWIRKNGYGTEVRVVRDRKKADEAKVSA
jgi:hypothetical protein